MVPNCAKHHKPAAEGNVRPFMRHKAVEGYLSALIYLLTQCHISIPLENFKKPLVENK